MDNRINRQIDGVVNDIRRFSDEVIHPIVIAVDGGSGSGKSTVAERLGCQLQASLVPLDDFFSIHIPDDKWDNFSTEDKLLNVFDWQRIKDRVLIPLRNGLPVNWQNFDFLSGIQPDGKYKLAPEIKTLNPSEIILLEGSYSAGPFLEDVVDKSILIDVPADIRHKRLTERDDELFLKKWHERWDAVESYYFGKIRPVSSFDWVIEG